MSVVSIATATWSGSLAEGSGSTSLASSGLGSFATTWKARSEGSDSVTTPEELLGAALATCYSMAMSHELAGRDLTAVSIDVRTNVTFVPGEGITRIGLSVQADVPGLSGEDFADLAVVVKEGCPVSKALAATTIELEDVNIK
jgi:lipoyl-dependent peroxiredoxin